MGVCVGTRMAMLELTKYEVCVCMYVFMHVCMR